MTAFLALLFWKTHFSFSEVIWRNRCHFQKIILLLFGIMPIFSFFWLVGLLSVGVAIFRQYHFGCDLGQ